MTSVATPTVPALPVVFSLAQRELVRFFRQRSRVMGAFLQPIIFWVLFSEGLRTIDLGYGHFFPGTLAMILLFTAIYATISVIEDRNEGFLQGVLVAPVPRWAMVMGKILGGSAIALLQSLLFLTLGWIVSGDVHPTAEQAMGAVFLMALMAIALTSLGFFIAWRLNSSQAFHGIMMVILLPMWLLSGAFFPPGEGALSYVTLVNPLTYGVAGLRHYLHTVEFDSAGVVIDATAALPPLSVCWGVTALFASIMFAACWKIAGTRTQGDYVS